MMSRTKSLPNVPFVKASGCGNTFLIIDAANAPTDIAEFTRKICRPHTGVGADGVEWITPSTADDADVVARLINADGSEAEISGNGTRCVAAYWVRENGGTSVRVRTGAGVKECALISRADTNPQFEFEMNMGEPQLEGETELVLSSGPVKGIGISMGNPHFAVFVRDFNFTWQQMGAEIQAQKRFTQGTNVEFVRVVNESEIGCRFFERGVGETQSSGTGSCASAVAAIASGQVKSPVRVHSVGGTQEVRWEKEIFLRGPAQLICEGEFFNL